MERDFNVKFANRNILIKETCLGTGRLLMRENVLLVKNVTKVMSEVLNLNGMKEASI